MNWLFVTSPAPERSPFSTVEKRPPLGVGSLMSVLRGAGHNVSFPATERKKIKLKIAEDLLAHLWRTTGIEYIVLD